MFDCHYKLGEFYEQHVRLPKAERDKLADYRDRNLTRLRDGLQKLGKLQGASAAHYKKTLDQGSYAMHTLNQHRGNEYDIDTAVIFPEDALPASALDARKRVAEALNQFSEGFLREPEARTNAVTVWYAEGHHVDLAVYRERSNWLGQAYLEHAGPDWTRRDPEEIKRWFTEVVKLSSPNASSDGRMPEGQLRRVVRLLKSFARSRDSWSLPGGMIISALAAETYARHATRDDVALVDTMRRLSHRLRGNEDVRNPVDASQLLTSKEEHRAQVRRFRERVDEALARLAVLADPSCTSERAAAAWKWFFKHEYWGEVRDDAAAGAANGVVRFDLSVGVARSDGGRVVYRYRDHHQALPKNMHLRFEAEGITIQPQDTVRWTVKNTGDEAASAKDLGHEKTGRDRVTWRHTAYKGTHRMICEIIRSGTVVGQAERVIRIGDR